MPRPITLFIAVVVLGCSPQTPQPPPDVDSALPIVSNFLDSLLTVNSDSIAAQYIRMTLESPELARALAIDRIRFRGVLQCETTCVWWEPPDFPPCPDPMFDRVRECDRFGKDAEARHSCTKEALKGPICQQPR